MRYSVFYWRVFFYHICIVLSLIFTSTEPMELDFSITNNINCPRIDEELTNHLFEAENQRSNDLRTIYYNYIVKNYNEDRLKKFDNLLPIKLLVARKSIDSVIDNSEITVDKQILMFTTGLDYINQAIKQLDSEGHIDDPWTRNFKLNQFGTTGVHDSLNNLCSLGLKNAWDTRDRIRTILDQEYMYKKPNWFLLNAYSSDNKGYTFEQSVQNGCAKLPWIKQIYFKKTVENNPKKFYKKIIETPLNREEIKLKGLLKKAKLAQKNVQKIAVYHKIINTISEKTLLNNYQYLEVKLLLGIKRIYTHDFCKQNLGIEDISQAANHLEFVSTNQNDKNVIDHLVQLFDSTGAYLALKIFDKHKCNQFQNYHDARKVGNKIYMALESIRKCHRLSISQDVLDLYDPYLLQRPELRHQSTRYLNNVVELAEVDFNEPLLDVVTPIETSVQKQCVENTIVAQPKKLNKNKQNKKNIASKKQKLKKAGNKPSNSTVVSHSIGNKKSNMHKENQRVELDNLKNKISVYEKKINALNDNEGKDFFNKLAEYIKKSQKDDNKYYHYSSYLAGIFSGFIENKYLSKMPRNIEQSCRMFEEIVNNSNDDELILDVRSKLAKIYSDEKHKKKGVYNLINAENHLQELVNAGNNCAKFDLGHVQLRSKKYELARRNFNSCVQLGNSHAQLLCWLIDWQHKKINDLDFFMNLDDLFGSVEYLKTINKDSFDLVPEQWALLRKCTEKWLSNASQDEGLYQLGRLFYFSKDTKRQGHGIACIKDAAKRGNLKAMVLLARDDRNLVKNKYFHLIDILKNASHEDIVKSDLIAPMNAYIKKGDFLLMGYRLLNAYKHNVFNECLQEIESLGVLSKAYLADANMNEFLETLGQIPIDLFVNNEESRIACSISVIIAHNNAAKKYQLNENIIMPESYFRNIQDLYDALEMHLVRDPEIILNDLKVGFPHELIRFAKSCLSGGYLDQTFYFLYQAYRNSDGEVHKLTKLFFSRLILLDKINESNLQLFMGNQVENKQGKQWALDYLRKEVKKKNYIACQFLTDCLSAKEGPSLQDLQEARKCGKLAIKLSTSSTEKQKLQKKLVLIQNAIGVTQAFHTLGDITYSNELIKANELYVNNKDKKESIDLYKKLAEKNEINAFACLVSHYQAQLSTGEHVYIKASEVIRYLDCMADFYNKNPESVYYIEIIRAQILALYSILDVKVNKENQQDLAYMLNRVTKKLSLFGFTICEDPLFKNQ